MTKEDSERPSDSEAPAEAEGHENGDGASSDRVAEAHATAHDDGHGHAHGHGAHGHGAHSHAAHDDHISHVTPVKLLIGVFAALTILTILTVAVTAVDLGGQGNFIIAMIIATIKAGLVMAFFMHMWWDNKFNVTLFLTSFLFVMLFLGVSLTDRKEYQPLIDAHDRASQE